MQERMYPGWSGRRKGFTLPEVVLSLAICSVLLGAMASLIVVSSRSIPGRGTDSSMATAAAAVLEQMASDLAVATTVVQATPTVIEVKVPDRDGDGVEEDITYAQEGDSLLQIVAPTGKRVLIGSVSKFLLTYQTATSTTNQQNTVAAQPESAVATWSAGGLGGLLYLGYSLNTGKLLGQNFQPSLPASARSWKATRVQFCAVKDLFATGNIAVQLRTTDSTGQPTNTVLATAPIKETALPALLYGMNEVAFTNAPDLAPNQEIAIVIVCVSGCPAGTIGYTTLASGRATPMETWTNGDWSSSTLNVMPYIVYGTTTTTASQSAASNKLLQVGVQLQVGSLAAPVLSTTVNMLNTPGVL